MNSANVFNKSTTTVHVVVYLNLANIKKFQIILSSFKIIQSSDPLAQATRARFVRCWQASRSCASTPLCYSNQFKHTCLFVFHSVLSHHSGFFDNIAFLFEVRMIFVCSTSLFTKNLSLDQIYRGCSERSFGYLFGLTAHLTSELFHAFSE